MLAISLALVRECEFCCGQAWLKTSARSSTRMASSFAASIATRSPTRWPRRWSRVFRATFGRWPLVDPGVPVLDHLHWKTSGPFTRIGSMQARVDGRIAFATTSWASWMRIGGRRWLRVIYPDTAVDPAYQGRRIFSRSVSHRLRLVNEPHDLSLHERRSSIRQKGPLGARGRRWSRTG